MRLVSSLVCFVFPFALSIPLLLTLSTSVPPPLSLFAPSISLLLFALLVAPSLLGIVLLFAYLSCLTLTSLSSSFVLRSDRFLGLLSSLPHLLSCLWSFGLVRPCLSSSSSHFSSVPSCSFLSLPRFLPAPFSLFPSFSSSFLRSSLLQASLLPKPQCTIYDLLRSHLISHSKLPNASARFFRESTLAPPSSPPFPPHNKNPS